jgi:hypothetical protein
MDERGERFGDSGERVTFRPERLKHSSPDGHFGGHSGAIYA